MQFAPFTYNNEGGERPPKIGLVMPLDWFNSVWFGLVTFGLVWYSLVWSDMVQRGYIQFASVCFAWLQLYLWFSMGYGLIWFDLISMGNGLIYMVWYGEWFIIYGLVWGMV